MPDTLRIQWAPKVKPSLILQLYRRDALGLLDAELVAEVGYALLARCRSILMVTDARRVDCPACGAEIACPGERWSRQQPVVCLACGWRASYGQWRDSWRHQDLIGGNAVPSFQAYARDFPLAKSDRERMLLIDRLIHDFHQSLRHRRTFRPAAHNLIQGSPEEVLALLDGMSYGPGSTQGLAESKTEWRRRVEQAAEEFPFLKERLQKIR